MSLHFYAKRLFILEKTENSYFIPMRHIEQYLFDVATTFLPAGYAFAIVVLSADGCVSFGSCGE
jgi:hypothetical protein